MKYLYILLGGGIGSLCRFLLSSFINNISNKTFPFGTLTVNLLGCFLIGFLFSVFEKFIVSSNIRLFIFVGLLGGLTTFSSFGLETFNLLRQAEFKYAIFNLLLNNLVGIVFVLIGFKLSSVLFGD
ncbi:MAG: hypothetical protein A2086_04335 [Spirochaetes bacterium GWD1_27_9]|nr:MAG: hypothetical protein A2Z98_06080 [Spirochaetes bacterium GWB1_27_13]OHD41386.1 MAG: hypothetical protein A2086_04335 [Spirochaetes bacterium GWD1_27_9]